jgi:hypothetical protein
MVKKLEFFAWQNSGHICIINTYIEESLRGINLLYRQGINSLISHRCPSYNTNSREHSFHTRGTEKQHDLYFIGINNSYKDTSLSFLKEALLNLNGEYTPPPILKKENVLGIRGKDLDIFVCDFGDFLLMEILSQKNLQDCLPYTSKNGSFRVFSMNCPDCNESTLFLRGNRETENHNKTKISYTNKKDIITKLKTAVLDLNSEVTKDNRTMLFRSLI